METFRGKAHLPGADREWTVVIEIEWKDKEVNVHIEEAPGGLSDWPGLAVQTFGQLEEISFRTKGIPPLFTHWWHLMRSGGSDMFGIVLGTPDAAGVWRTCPLPLNKVS